MNFIDTTGTLDVPENHGVNSRCVLRKNQMNIELPDSHTVQYSACLGWKGLLCCGKQDGILYFQTVHVRYDQECQSVISFKVRVTLNVNFHWV
jgi:hypothetical protein